MRWHQHNHQAIYGRPPRMEVRQVSPGSYNDGEARVCVIGVNTGEERSLKKEMGEVLSEENGGDQVQPRSTLGSNGGDDGGG